MSMVVKKRQVIAATLTLALGAAVFVNWYFTRPEAQQTSANPENPSVISQESDQNKTLGDAQYVSGTLANAENKQGSGEEPEFFVSSKVSRKAAHDESFDKLNKIINSGEADATAKKQASEDLKALTAVIKQEADCENLIKAKLSGSCLVIINGKNVQVIIEKGKVSDTAALQIKDIVMKQIGVTAENITIIEAK